MPRSQRISDPYKVIVALQIIRYHLDSLLFWPKDLSDREISSIPVISGLEENYFRRLAIWYSAIEKYL